MSDFLELSTQIVEKYDLAATGSTKTLVDGVHLYHRDRPVERQSLIYSSGIAIIITGRKIGYLGGRSYEYNSEKYLALGLPLALECETLASRDDPMLAMFIKIDPSVVRDVALALNISPPTATHGVPAIAAAPYAPEMRDAVQRLLRQLASDRDAAILGAGTVREIIYRALEGEAGAALHGLLNYDGQTARIARVMKALHTHPAHKHSVDEMARVAGMSPSAFHRAFRQVTDDTPLQYLKKVRLSQATSLIVHQGYRVGVAAAAVGYASAAQFSRDFKSHFGVNPVDAKSVPYAFVNANDTPDPASTPHIKPAAPARDQPVS